MPKQRFLSLDVMRGLTLALMILVNTPGSWSAVYAPLLHANWHGATPTDFIFPFFLFIVGSALFFSSRSRSQAQATVTARLLKIVRRGPPVAGQGPGVRPGRLVVQHPGGGNGVAGI